MSEALQFEGRLTRVRLDLKAGRLRLEAARDALRSALDPFEAVHDLDAEKVMALAAQFGRLQSEQLELLGQEKALVKALGR
jgi:hypothetical protein